MSDNPASSRRQISDEAAGWVVRLADRPSDADRARFEAWKAQGIAHEIAFQRALATWERLDKLTRKHHR